MWAQVAELVAVSDEVADTLVELENLKRLLPNLSAWCGALVGLLCSCGLRLASGASESYCVDDGIISILCGSGRVVALPAMDDLAV